MKFFLDTADVAEIKDLLPTGLIDGVTTNPSLIAKSGRKIADVIAEIADLVKGPVSAEVTALDYDGMMAEGNYLAAIAPNIAIKVPLTPAGLRACHTLSHKGKMVNVTLCFSAAQALLAAKSGATFVSPFLGRLDDIAQDGTQLIADIVEMYAQFPSIHTEVLAASIRHPLHVVDVARLGCHVATLPPKILHQLYKHPLTDSGIESFMKDWAATGQSILG